MADVFLFDRNSQVIQRINLDLNGNEVSGTSRKVDISANGNFIAFSSFANNLVANDSNLGEDVFVYNRMTGQTEIVSRPNSAATAQFSNSSQPSISDDGRYVAFASDGSGFVPGDDNDYNYSDPITGQLISQPTTDVYRHDRQTGGFVLVSFGTDGSVVAVPNSSIVADSPSISGNGQRVAFAAQTQLTTDDFDTFSNIPRIVLRDLAASTGNLVASSATSPALSGDGTTTVYETIPTSGLNSAVLALRSGENCAAVGEFLVGEYSIFVFGIHAERQL